MAGRALSRDRGAIVRQIWGRSSTAVTLQSRMKFCRLLSHFPDGPVGELKTAGGAVSTGGIVLYCIFGCTGVEGRVGTSNLRGSWRAWRVASTRSTLVSALVMLWGLWSAAGDTQGKDLPVSSGVVCLPFPKEGERCSWRTGKENRTGGVAD